MKTRLFLISVLTALASSMLSAQSLKINDLEYFEDRGVNFLVYSNLYNGMFCDEPERCAHFYRWRHPSDEYS